MTVWYDLMTCSMDGETELLRMLEAGSHRQESAAGHPGSSAGTAHTASCKHGRMSDPSHSRPYTKWHLPADHSSVSMPASLSRNAGNVTNKCQTQAWL